MPDIVIRCPNKTHQKPICKLIDDKLVKRIPSPKILFVATADSVGRFKIQCSDTECRRTTSGRGWYEIEINGTGGYTVKPLPAKRLKLIDVPYALAECDE